MRFFKKKVVNPRLGKFVKDLQDSGFLLVNFAHFGKSSVFIQDPEEFRKFGKRKNHNGTIFRMAEKDHIYYFMLIDGAVVHTRIAKWVRK